MLPEGDLPGVWGTFVLMVVVLTRGCVFGGIHKFALRTSPFTIHKRCFKEPKANEGRKGRGWEEMGDLGQLEPRESPVCLGQVVWDLPCLCPAELGIS
jgi:hypothetical protein